MKTFYLTDAGKVRSHNEDSVTILKNQSDEYLLMVCDGMGGHRAGEVASSMVVTHMGKRFNEMASVGPKVDAINWMNDNINEVNRAIEEYAKKNPESLGMGTTVVAALVLGRVAVIAHVGDSRAYVLNDETISPVTKDHSFVQLLVDTGKITAEQAKTHPDRNVITRAVGIEHVVDVDVDVEDLGTKDKLLICTDGLNGYVGDSDILKTVIEYGDSSAEKLVETANNNGAPRLF